MTNLVVHCKRTPYDILIGRPSIWGNPFRIGVDGTREDVIEKYKEWFWTQEYLVNSVVSLYGKVLGCWCKPKACHGDFLIRVASASSDACDYRKSFDRAWYEVWKALDEDSA